MSKQTIPKVPFEQRLENAKRIIDESIPIEISNPWFFDFCGAVNDGLLSRELCNEMINYIHNHKVFDITDLDIDDSNMENPFSGTSIDLITDVIFAKFIYQITKCYQEQNDDSIHFVSLRDWFGDNIQKTYGSSETDCREYCHFSFETLCSYPINDSDILEELQILEKNKFINKQDWAWLDLVSTNAHLHSKKINNLLVKVAEKHQLAF
jgi:hypothetical protein